VIRQALRVATYNVHGCVGMDGRYDPERVAEVLRELDPDIIGLQEVDNHQPLRLGLHQLEFLRRATGLMAVPGLNISSKRGEYGNALLTRLRVADVRRLDLSVPGHEPRGAIDVDLIGPEGRLRVIVTHLGLRPSERRQQIAGILEALSPGPEPWPPTLLLGDINEWMPSGGVRVRALTGRFAADYCGRSFPAPCPVLFLDRIFAHPRPERARLSVHRSRLARWASDHLPLLGEFSWSEAPNNGLTEPRSQATLLTSVES
jgi:endonuclease/exonuclease/phosphatase family metal-dependent hydrolase